MIRRSRLRHASVIGSSISCLEIEAIAEPAQRDGDRRAVRRRLDLLAEIRHLVVDDAIVEMVTRGPRRRRAAARVRTRPAALDEAASNLNSSAVSSTSSGAAHLAAREIDFGVAETELSGASPAPRAAARLDAGAQLARAERLRHVIVGAELEAKHLFGFLRLAPSADDRHRSGRRGGFRGRRRSRPCPAASRRATSDRRVRRGRFARCRRRLSPVTS